MDIWVPLMVAALHAAPIAAPATASTRTAQSTTGTQAVATPPVDQHVHAHEESEPPPLCPICPAARAASGTSWQPDAGAVHHRWRQLGSWRYAAHVDASLARTDEGGPRGDEATYVANFAMVNLQRRAGAGVLGVQSMWSLEPAMGRRGYPLLLQTGETADGVTPLVDRQHPHDMPMELAVTYARPVGSDRAFFLYVAAVGAPAVGPPAFMHRASGSLLPASPITHHWFDSTHVSFGVVTAGFLISPRAQVEGSVFRGREPDQDRWGFERPGLDSFAFRLSVNPVPQLSLQVSAATLHDAEQLHPGADLARVTASAMYSAPWRGLRVDATLAWARNTRTTSLVPVEGGFFVYPGSVAQAVLAEATVSRSRHAVITRVEHAAKDEMFPLPDPRHAVLFPVTRATAGYAFQIVETRLLTAQLGAAAAWNFVDNGLAPIYGERPRSGLLFARVQLH